MEFPELVMGGKKISRAFMRPSGLFLGRLARLDID
jgi:hypothetical protein